MAKSWAEMDSIFRSIGVEEDPLRRSAETWGRAQTLFLPRMTLWQSGEILFFHDLRFNLLLKPSGVPGISPLDGPRRGSLTNLSAHRLQSGSEGAVHDSIQTFFPLY